MKIQRIAPFLLILAACNQSPRLQITVKGPGITDGALMLKKANQVIFNESFKSGELAINKQLQSPGFYKLSLINHNQPISDRPGFDVYLENTAYTIEPQALRPDAYPQITTSSAIQKELSAYYALVNKTAGPLDQQIDSLSHYLKSAAAASLSKQNRAAMYTRTRALQKKRREMDLEMLELYTGEHPQSKIAAHLMNQQYVEENPKGYNAIFQKFSPYLKTSDDGLMLSNKLAPLVGIMTDSPAPEIVGSTPEGKPFNKAELHKKAMLVEFWKPSNSTSRLLHQRLIQGIILTPADNKNLAIISVSIDENRAAWLEAIKDEHKNWLDYSDLKGDNSPNVSKWGIKAAPAYYLLDSSWHTIKSNIDFSAIDTEVHEYLQAH